MRTVLKAVIIVFLFVLPFVAAQAAEGVMLGGTPYKGWEEGGNDFVVLFNSLVDDQITLYNETTNRQGDTCILESSFDLTGFHIPDDAVLVEAYAIWMGAVDPAKFNDPTDNQVHLKFVRNDNNYTWEDDIIVGDAAKTLGDTSDPFAFQSVRFSPKDGVTTGCSPTSPGTSATGEVAYFTYRKNITDFFKKIQDDNLASDNPLKDGLAMFGKYTVSGLDCTDHDYYKCRTTMVSTWSIILVYKSGSVRSKKIYLYPGFAWAQGETTTANVSGFTLPKNPVLRITTNIAEGDPALVKAELPPELIYIKGPEAMSTYQLTNTCNPLVDMSFEIYNSQSSIIGWEGDLMCVSGVAGGPDYFGIDNDTFLLDAEEDINLQEHLKLGGTDFDVRISVNQDAILMNYLVVSVDTKAPAFDIPEDAQINFPYDREKHYCSCRKAEDPEDAYCVTESGGYPMYYLIRVQNWGTNVAKNVIVVDDLDNRVEYIPGTTEIATKFEDTNNPQNGTDWVTIPDLAGNGTDPNTKFPLSGAGYKVADSMDICNQATRTCVDTRLLRFKVKPKKLPKNEVIPNIAIIKEEGSAESYRSNRDLELKLYRGTCQPLETCPEPRKEDCGGVAAIERECDENKPCPDGSICNMTSFTCQPDPDKTCTSAKVSYAVGINSPDSGDSPIIVPKGTTGLTLGQFKLQAENCGQSKYYGFVSVRMDIKKDDTQVAVTNLSLIHDKDGNGVADPDDPVLINVPTPEAASVLFAIPEGPTRRFTGTEIHHFIVTGDLGYNNTKVPAAASMHLAIPNKNSFLFEDAGDAKPDGGTIDFASFQVEPTDNYFIVTKGMNDPAVPPANELNRDIPVLQVRTKALDLANKVKRITVTVPTQEGYARFGQGIKDVSLYIDTNGDGTPDDLVKKISTFEEDDEVVFEGDDIETRLDYDVGEEMFLIFQCTLNIKLDGTERAKIVIRKGAVILQNTSKKVEGLAVSSKEFYPSDDIQTDGDVVPPASSSCSCSVVADGGDDALPAWIALLLAGMAALVPFLRRRPTA